ncbi:MAG: D-alanine--D-alanine ligase [Bacteroidota bacterium]
MNKLSLALLFGGKSPEHEVSFRSAKNIFEALDPSKYEITLIGVSYEGAWYRIPASEFPQLEHLHAGNPYEQLCLVPGADDAQLFSLEKGVALPSIDIVFPIIHGTNGEDGTLQGLLQQLEIPYVGPDVCGSAVAMDKDVAKRLLREADLLVAAGECFDYTTRNSLDFAALRNQLGSPLFIKPANMGSSIGVSKVETAEAFEKAVEHAFQFDKKIIVEEAIEGRELECAVMGNEIPETTRVGEVLMEEGFYDYEAKYIHETVAKVQIPAEDIAEETLSKLILVARSAYKVLCCEGMARVDMFLCPDGRVYINEVNTLPGFTSISMYPKLWQDAGLSYSALLDHLIQLALERGKRDKGLKVMR